MKSADRFITRPGDLSWDLPGIGVQLSAELSGRDAWRAELRDRHGRWARGGPAAGPFSPGIRHLYGLLHQVDEAAAAGHYQDAEAGTQAHTRIVTLPSGEKVIDKQHEDRVDADREELAGYVAQAIGAPAPAVYRAAPNRLLEQYVPGKVAARYFSDMMQAARDKAEAGGRPALEVLKAEEEAEDKARDAVFATPQARAIADLDYLTSNSDRHEYNWIIGDDGRPTAIDHGVVGFDGMPSDSPFVRASDPMVRGHPGAETPGAADAVRFRQDRAAHGRGLAARLARVQPQFARTGHQDWFVNMMETPVAQLIDPVDPPDYQTLMRQVTSP